MLRSSAAGLPWGNQYLSACFKPVLSRYHLVHCGSCLGENLLPVHILSPHHFSFLPQSPFTEGLQSNYSTHRSCSIIPVLLTALLQLFCIPKCFRVVCSGCILFSHLFSISLSVIPKVVFASLIFVKTELTLQGLRRKIFLPGISRAHQAKWSSLFFLPLSLVN